MSAAAPALQDPERWHGRRFGDLIVWGEPDRIGRVVVVCTRCGNQCRRASERLQRRAPRPCRSCLNEAGRHSRVPAHWGALPYELDHGAQEAVALAQHLGGLTYREVAKLIGVTFQRVQMIEREALAALRRTEEGKRLCRALQLRDEFRTERETRAKRTRVSAPAWRPRMRTTSTESQLSYLEHVL